MTKPGIDGVARAEGDPNDTTATADDHLELLSAAGVAMAGSFDIRDILRETHRAASLLLGGPAVDVLYSGRTSIKSRSLWFPAEPGAANFPAPERERITRSLRRVAPGGSRLDALLARELPGTHRGAIPLRCQGELLGVLFFALPPVASERPSDEGRKLLSILAQHAATALRNIHLAQERIHFERLSAIGRMIGSIVHDFRSPLTALRGYAGMVATLELTDAERRQYGRWILEECDRLNHMVAELLEFSRGGPTELSLDWVSVADYLGRFAERLGRHYRERRIEVAIASHDPGEARIDAARFERALWNIATNACQSMPGGGRLKLSSARRGEDLVVEIEDEGCGIPEEIRHRVFEPFFSYGKSEGIGLGMATASKIVEEHGGRIEIEAVPEGGTRVRFVVPIAGPADTLQPAAEPDHTASRF